MKLSLALAKHFQDVNTGGNWTSVNLKEVLTGVTWEQATQKVANLNTMYTLVFHLNYYVELQLRVLRGGPITGDDKQSFEHPPMTSQKQWEEFLTNVFGNVSAMATAVASLKDKQLEENFANTEKYGSYYRNIQGLIEHHHYHLGQIVLLKKMIASVN
ncbi:MAG: DinB family protein [Patiriisocius sp.]|uniref:DinB family protein n=1 Tax=Patiriisocius sp. TaxID=2822396 RepID=UPI003EF941BC